MNLRDSWEAEAERWVRFARAPGHDSAFWSFGLNQLLELLPAPGQLTVDLGCGEGRLVRVLRSRGYTVVGLDSSQGLLKHAIKAEAGRFVAADAARIPFQGGCADLVIAYMSLHDLDDLDSAVEESARILMPGGRFCFAVVHPMASAGRVEEPTPDAPLVIRGNYLESSRYRFDSDREGVACSFHSMHRPLESYVQALESAELLIETLREPPVSDELIKARPAFTHHRRFPLCLFGRAVKRRKC